MKKDLRVRNVSNLTFYLLQQNKERKSNEWGSGFRARKQKDNEDLEITAEITVYYHTIVIYCWYLKLSHTVIPKTNSARCCSIPISRKAQCVSSVSESHLQQTL